MTKKQLTRTELDTERKFMLYVYLTLVLVFLLTGGLKINFRVIDDGKSDLIVHVATTTPLSEPSKNIGW